MYILSKLRYRYSNMVRAELQVAAVALRSTTQQRRGTVEIQEVEIY